jgi:peptidoglycan/LPS O-acetylase OafA/YrhL
MWLFFLGIYLIYEFFPKYQYIIPNLESLRSSDFVHFALIFLSGSVLSFYMSRINIGWGLAPITSFDFILSKYSPGYYKMIGAIGFSFIAFHLVLILNNFGGKTVRSIAVRPIPDLSYGLYLWSFPMQQYCAQLLLPTHGFVPTFFASLALSIAASIVSWYLIEKPSFRIRDRLTTSYSE